MHRRYCIDLVFEDNGFVPIGTGHSDDQGNTAPVSDEMSFSAKFSAVRGVLAGPLVPLGLAIAAPSMLARVQSI
ncbi:hypothetical protein Cmtc_17590 [Cupriavidus sp. TKC]|nr:hypothetical protein Cmtc_17590 [Cupriavidus sp. TKC]